MRRVIAEQPRAKVAVTLAVPDLAQRLLEGVAENQRVVVALDERRDAARQHVTVRRNVHQRPRAAAMAPRLLIAVLPRQTVLWRGRARSAKFHAQFTRHLFRLPDP